MLHVCFDIPRVTTTSNDVNYIEIRRVIGYWLPDGPTDFVGENRWTLKSEVPTKSVGPYGSQYPMALRISI